MVVLTREDVASRVEGALGNDVLRSWVTVVVVGILLIGRRPSSLFHPQLWAEDGPIFYQQELISGSIHALVTPYAGYLHAIPRLTSMLAAHVPAAYVPLIYALVAFSIAIWACSVFADAAFRPIVHSDAMRLLVCFAFATVAPANELIGTLTNVHWYLSLALFLFLIADTSRVRRSALLNALIGAGVLLAALSSPETIPFAPLAIWKIIRSESTSARVIPIAILVGLAIQVWTLLFSHSGGPALSAPLDGLFLATMVAFVYRVLVSAIAGQSSAEFISGGGLQGLALLIELAFAAAVTLIATRLPRARVATLWLLATCFVLIAVSIGGRELVSFFSSLTAVTFGGERYFFIPTAAFILATAVVLENLPRLRLDVRAALLFCVFIGGAIRNYHPGDFTDLNWSSYAPSIDRWIALERERKPSPGVVVPTNPPGWKVTLPARS
jgi:hypothetical protein